MIQEKLRQLTLIPSITYEENKKKKVEQHTFELDNTDTESKIDANKRKEKEYDSSRSVFEKIYEPSISAEIVKTAHHDPTEKEITESSKDNLKDSALRNEMLGTSTQSPVEEVSCRVPEMYPIGQYRGTYILAQNENGLYMIDQHEAQERNKNEFFKEQLGKPSSDLQQLLFPLTFEFTKSEMIYIDNNMDKLESVGLFLESFGENTYAVRSYPTWFPKGLEEDIIRDMVTQIIEHEQVNIEKIREEVAILMACKRSIKANHYLSESEMITLLDDLRKSTDPFTCPHGRPVIIHFTNYEIERMFKRIM